jgi:hypothetical protein
MNVYRLVVRPHVQSKGEPMTTEPDPGEFWDPNWSLQRLLKVPARTRLTELDLIFELFESNGPGSRFIRTGTVDHLQLDDYVLVYLGHGVFTFAGMFLFDGLARFVLRSSGMVSGRGEFFPIKNRRSGHHLRVSSCLCKSVGRG